MKVLHTADLHIRKKGDERWQALEKVIGLCTTYKVDVLVIAGDMFDKGIDGESLRPHVRKLFEESSFTTLILPGNHDYEVFESGRYWGSNVQVINDYIKPYKTKDVNFWGLPYEELREEEVLERLYDINERMDDEKTNILIFHGELTDTYQWLKGFGDEGNKRYMPVKKAYFKDTKIKYVLAGHFHTNFDVIELPTGGYFVYPGSPVSVTSKELGKRKVNLFEVGKAPKEVTLDTFCYEYIQIDLDPFSEKDPVKYVDEQIKTFLNTSGHNCKITVQVKGYIDSSRHAITESDFNEHLSKIQEKYGPVISAIYNEIQDLSYIFNNDLFREFTKRLQEKGFDNDEKKEITEYVIKAMMETLR